MSAVVAMNEETRRIEQFNYRFAGNYLPILYKNCRLSSLHPKKKEQIKRRDFCTLLAPFLDV